MKKLIINNGKALADSTGKVLAIESDVTITSKGGWQGTAVPNSGHVENVYFNTNLSVDEVNNIFADVLTEEVAYCYGLLISSDGNKRIFIEGSSPNIFGIAYSNGENTEILYCSGEECKEAFGLEFVGWNPTFNDVIEINNEVVNIFDDTLFGQQNNLLSSLFSTTPFVQASGESIGLSGEYDGSPIEVTESVDMKALIDEKKIPLLINVKGGSSVIEVEEFPTENVQDLTFYKKTSKTNSDVYLVMDGSPMSFGSMGAFIYEVDTLPSDMQISDLENNILYLYVYDSKAYLYDGSNVMTFGELYTNMGIELLDRGSVESIDQMTNDGVYVIYGKEVEQIGVNNKTYNFVDGVWNDYYDLFFGIMNCTIETLETPLIKTLRKFICANCMNLKYVKLINCKIVGENVFNDCMSLREVYLPICEQIDSNAFYDTGNVQLYLGFNGVVEITNKTFNERNTNLVVHVRPEYLSDYESHLHWASVVSNGYITLVGDYTD